MCHSFISFFWLQTVRKQLSRWLRDQVQVFDKYGNASLSLTRFFKDQAEKLDKVSRIQCHILLLLLYPTCSLLQRSILLVLPRNMRSLTVIISYCTTGYHAFGWSATCTIQCSWQNCPARREDDVPDSWQECWACSEYHASTICERTTREAELDAVGASCNGYGWHC